MITSYHEAPGFTTNTFLSQKGEEELLFYLLSTSKEGVSTLPSNEVTMR
jgi:hypothetical protein